jgi:outer membrane protein assembly factor BamB
MIDNNMKKFSNAIILIACSTGLMLTSCNNDQLLKYENEVIKYVPFLWKTPIQKGDNYQSNSYIKPNLIYKGKPILPIADEKGKTKLSYADIRTGKQLWNWRDVFKNSEYVDINEAYIHNDKLLYGVGGRHYSINLETGKTFWKIQRNSSFRNRISGLEEEFFLLSDAIDTLGKHNTTAIFKGNVQTGQINQYLLTDIDTSILGENDLVTSVGLVKPVKFSNNKFLIVASSQPYPNWYYSILLGLYDLSNEEWIYNRKLVSGKDWSNSISNIVFYEEKIYLTAGKDLACHDFYTGEELWNRQFSRDFLFSGFIVKDGIVVANCENEVLYGLDAKTGNKLWEGQGAGTSSKLEGRYLNGIVYFSGGSTSRIHAVDIYTGETVWLLDPSEYDKKVDDFKSTIYVIPGEDGEKGKVVITTHWDAYCLEAYR